jgi:hypothetical protein
VSDDLIFWDRKGVGNSTVAITKISKDIRKAPKHIPMKMAQSLKPCIAVGFPSGSSVLFSFWGWAVLPASSDLVALVSSGDKDIFQI